MAKSKLPGPIERRHLVERDLSTAQALRYAEAYLEEGRDQDAVEFLVKAEAEEQLEAMRQRSIETGDVFLLRTLSAATGVTPDHEQWQQLAEAAAAAGKERYAAEALRHAERWED